MNMCSVNWKAGYKINEFFCARLQRTYTENKRKIKQKNPLNKKPLAVYFINVNLVYFYENKAQIEM